jgi:hypothetical protein
MKEMKTKYPQHYHHYLFDVKMKKIDHWNLLLVNQD